MTATAIGRFMAERGVDDYEALWRWSVEDLEGFWAAVWEFCGVQASVPYRPVLSSHQMPGARWFEGARLSYAEHALGRRGGAAAVVGVSHRPQPPKTDAPLSRRRRELHRTGEPVAVRRCQCRRGRGPQLPQAARPSSDSRGSTSSTKRWYWPS